MTIEHAHPYLHELDKAVWARIVTELLHSTTTAAVPRDAEQLMLGAGSGTLLFRVTGTASTAPDTNVPWSVIVKFLTHEPGLGDPSDADLGAWNYWKREWHVCRSDWLPRFRGRSSRPGVSPPANWRRPTAWRCLARPRGPRRMGRPAVGVGAVR